jgi:hypothetical protein
MMRRYFGRATGHHRGQKSWSFKTTPLFWLCVTTGLMVLALIAVLIINPGSDLPADEKGSRPSTGVTPESPSPSVSEFRGTT